MKTIIKAGGGSTTGSTHRNSNRNNQDSYAFREGNGYVVGVVADGCGSAHRSEFGAHLVAYRVAESLDSGMAEAHANGPIVFDPKNPWAGILYDTVVHRAVGDALSALDNALRIKKGSSKEDQRHFSEKLYEYGLCTLVMMIVTETYVAIWSVGDGAYATLLDIHEPPHNGLQLGFVAIEPCEGNKPPYLGYRLDPRTIFEDTKLLYPRKQMSMALSCDDHHAVGIAIMSDGFKATHEAQIAEILRDPKFTENPHKTTQFLNRQNAGKQRINWEEHRIDREPTTFEDDATIVFVQFQQERTS